MLVVALFDLLASCLRDTSQNKRDKRRTFEASKVYGTEIIKIKKNAALSQKS